MMGKLRKRRGYLGKERKGNLKGLGAVKRHKRERAARKKSGGELKFESGL